MIWLQILIVGATVLLMEGAAWLIHKYVMHGVMWNWHQDHHNHHKGFFEKNDYFAVVFSLVSIVTIAVGLRVESLWFLLWIGIGVLIYGAFYFIFHDIIVHRRIKIRYSAKHPYMRRIMNAHYIHHRVHTREGSEAFGFLFAPKKFEPKTRD